jgi:hypothetical protein
MEGWRLRVVGRRRRLILSFETVLMEVVGSHGMLLEQ